jgi:hypothetical protein
VFANTVIRRSAASLTTCVATVSAVACNSATPPDISPHLVASITDTTVVQYSGDAAFLISNHVPTPQFQLLSQTQRRDALPKNEFQRIMLTAWGGVPAKGDHEVAAVGSSSESVWLYYTRATDDGYYEKYMSISGTLTVDYASDDRVIGNFTLDAVLYCRRPQNPDAPRGSDPCDPRRLDLTRPHLTIIGSFVGEKVVLTVG